MDKIKKVSSELFIKDDFSGLEAGKAYSMVNGRLLEGVHHPGYFRNKGKSNLQLNRLLKTLLR